MEIDHVTESTRLPTNGVFIIYPYPALNGPLLRCLNRRKLQEERFPRTKIFNNAGMNSRHLKTYCPIDAESGVLLEWAMAHARILKIARTIWDLEDSGELRASHLAEAIQYRTLDRKL